MSKALAPIVEKVDRLSNARNAEQRRGGKKPTKAAPAEPETDDDDTDEDLDEAELAKLDKGTLIETLKRQNRRISTIEARDRGRQAEDEKTATKSALKTAIAAGKHANADLLEMIIGDHRVKKGTRPGEFVYDDGTTVVPLADKVKEIGSRPEFRPTNPGGGTNTAQTFQVPDQKGGSRTVTAADLAKMPKADRMKALKAISTARPRTN